MCDDTMNWGMCAGWMGLVRLLLLLLLVFECLALHAFKLFTLSRYVHTRVTQDDDANELTGQLNKFYV